MRLHRNWPPRRVRAHAEMQAQARSAKALISLWLQRVHARFSSLGPRTEAQAIAGGCILLALAFTLPIVLPARTFSFQYVHDVLIFFDGAQRVIDGQIPSRDFHTPLGLLAYLLPGFGLWASGSLGGMMPLATAAFCALFLPMLIYVCVSRLPLAYAAIFAVSALSLVVSPASIGDTLPSFGMFYNRWGYGLLAILFLLVLPQQRGRSATWADAILAASVLLLTFYLKISYFAVAAGFTALLLLFPTLRGMAALALLIAAAGIALIHLFWGGTATYLADIRMAGSVTGTLRASLLGVIRMTVGNAAMILPFVMVIGLAVVKGVSSRTLFLSFAMAGAGLLLLIQNHQGVGMMTLVPAGIVTAVALARAGASGAKDPVALTALLLVATLALPPAVLAGQSILVHSLMAIRGGDPREYVAEIDGFMAQEVSRPTAGEAGFGAVRQAYREGKADLHMLQLMRGQALRQVLAQPEYLWTLEDGARLLHEDPRLEGTVFTLDMANPLPALAQRQAPRGLDAWYHAGRTFNQEKHRAPQQMFADIDVIMVPKAPVDPASHFLLARLYAGYIERHYDLVGTSDYWRAYARKRPLRSS